MLILGFSLAWREFAWSRWANFYLGAYFLGRALHNATYTGFLSLYLLPRDQALDIRIQAGSLGLSLVFLILFHLHFVDARTRYPAFDLFFRLLAAVTAALACWALFDYEPAFRGSWRFRRSSLQARRFCFGGRGVTA